MFYVFILFCAILRAGSGLATGRSPIKEVLPTVYMITKLKKSGQDPTESCKTLTKRRMNE
jgi:hypothetical protein